MPVEWRRPGTGALGPLDQHDRALANHVVKAEIAGFVGLAQAVAIDVVDRRRAGMVVMDQRVRRAGGARFGSQAAADGLDQRRLPGPQLSRQPNDGGGAELAAEVFTEPAEPARREEHRPWPPGADRPAPPPARNRDPRRRPASVAPACG